MTPHEVTDDPSTAEHAPAPATPAPDGPVPRKAGRLIFILIVLALAGGGYFLWKGRGASGEAERAPAAPPSVAVAAAALGDIAQTLTVAGEFHPYQQAALHAKIAGFLQSISVDVGDRVKEGQTLAQLDVPELKSELDKAAAALRATEQEVIRAEANYNEAYLASQRLQDVAKQNPRLVAAQELDAVQAREQSAAGALDAAKQRTHECQAEVNKVRSMLAYTTITAPFDGVITRRYADPGALIAAGTASNAQPVVDIAEHRRLRLTFPVPESAASLVKVDAPLRVQVESLGLTMKAKVSRFSGKVDRATRTMATEADIDNTDGRLRPGLYASVALVLRESKGALTVPAQGVGGGEKAFVLAVTKSGVVEERKVQIGLQTSARMEILSGLQPGEMVIVGSRSGIQPGQKVAPKPVEMKSLD